VRWRGYCFVEAGGGRGFDVRFGCLARFVEGVGGVLVRQARELMRGGAALRMRGCGYGVGVRRKIVVLGGSVVNALGHGNVPLCR
jgi:hypothetical protein